MSDQFKTKTTIWFCSRTIWALFLSTLSFPFSKFKGSSAIIYLLLYIILLNNYSSKVQPSSFRLFSTVFWQHKLTQLWYSFLLSLSTTSVITDQNSIHNPRVHANFICNDVESSPSPTPESSFLQFLQPLHRMTQQSYNRMDIVTAPFTHNDRIYS